ncbi:MAG: hypothetical protein RMK73_03490 [Geminicoccaceae bacterium]|nr:hypothetical protein [Geminicoccaceae bacterium]MCS7268771.1 hypothetical protein [Geminicoccaceae bacterium]MDW8125681.1 hypothetical protein [Geminicoccaceae bacterium]MDW8340529.1 hypothetical protein [Geminicoccaceae bacterium]
MLRDRPRFGPLLLAVVLLLCFPLALARACPHARAERPAVDRPGVEPVAAPSVSGPDAGAPLAEREAIRCARELCAWHCALALAPVPAAGPAVVDHDRGPLADARVRLRPRASVPWRPPPGFPLERS